MVQQNEWVAAAEIQTESGENWALNYYVQEFSGEDEQFFGLRIDKSTPEGVLHESEETLAITDSHAKAVAMAQFFAKGSVTPIVLLEMVDEWQSELDCSSTLLPT